MTEDEYYAGEFTDAELNCQPTSLFFYASSAAFRVAGQFAAHELHSPTVKSNSLVQTQSLFFRLAKGFPEVLRHIANEAVNRRFRDAVSDYCVHGFSQQAERWFVETFEVQLCFSPC
jgi:hypothetical protein